MASFYGDRSKGKKIFGILTDFRAYHTADPEPHRPNLIDLPPCCESDCEGATKKAYPCVRHAIILSEEGVGLLRGVRGYLPYIIRVNESAL